MSDYEAERTEFPPPPARGEGPVPYTGTWTLEAYNPDDSTRITDIESFILEDGIWFVSSKDEITAVPLCNWSMVSLGKDDSDE